MPKVGVTEMNIEITQKTKDEVLDKVAIYNNIG
jgi:hypothetical protein